MKKVGIWGTGLIANNHAQSLRACGQELYIIVSRDEEKARNFAQKWSCPNYGTDKTAFLNKGISAVHVVSPPACHYSEVKFLLENGISVFCEKPLCLDVSEGEELLSLAKEKGLVCGVNLNTRNYPALIHGKELIEKGDLGKIFLIHGSYLQEFHCLPCPFGWRYNEEVGGKMRAATEIGSHILNLCTYLLGDKIEEVSATFGNFIPKRELVDGFMVESENGGLEISSEDCALISFKTAKGTLGNIVLNEMAKGRLNRLSLELNGSQKSLYFNSEKSGEIKISTENGFATKIFPFDDNSFSGSFTKTIGDFYRKIDNKNQKVTFADFKEGLELIKVCEAIYQSANNGSAWTKI